MYKIFPDFSLTLKICFSLIFFFLNVATLIRKSPTTKTYLNGSVYGKQIAKTLLYWLSWKLAYK